MLFITYFTFSLSVVLFGVFTSLPLNPFVSLTVSERIYQKRLHRRQRVKELAVSPPLSLGWTTEKQNTPER
jgi:hypothetical protein